MKRVIFIALSLTMMAGCAKDKERYDTPVAKQVEIESASPSQTVFDTVTEVVFPITANVPWTVKVTTDNPQVAVREFVVEVLQLALTVEYQPGTMYFSPLSGSSRWSPELTIHTSGPGMTGTYTYLSKEYPIELCCPTDEKITSYAYRGFTLNGTSLRFNIGRAVPGWIILPCPFHQKIVSVTIKCTAANKEFTIYESVNGSGVGQNALTESVTLANGNEHKFVWLEGKAPGLGQSVCIYSKTTNAQISLLTVVYE